MLRTGCQQRIASSVHWTGIGARTEARLCSKHLSAAMAEVRKSGREW
jgi:hypothetical protein